MSRVLWLVFLLPFLTGCNVPRSGIDRQDVVSRHQVVLNEVDTLNSLTLGNGRFAMTMDVTGLQTFPAHYQNGVPLGTMSEWGWHSFPANENYRIEETLDSLESHGRKVPYAVQWPADTRAGKAGKYIRQNPHRIHLATIGWNIRKTDGSSVSVADINKIDQVLDIWNGELISRFEVEGVQVEVISLISQDQDLLSVQVKSPLIEEGRLGLQIRFPYPTDAFLDEAANYDPQEEKRLVLNPIDPHTFSIQRTLDSTRYFTNFSSTPEVVSVNSTNDGFQIRPDSIHDTWTFSVMFSEAEAKIKKERFVQLRQEVNADFQHFWRAGGMIDFGEVDDPRAHELERRMILSLYLTYINCAGNFPPQETGLTYNSWYGKPHMEMIWWHGVHFALWSRPDVLERQMEWYLRNTEAARKVAWRQGFEGVRWQKMTDNQGGETVSSIGSYLIWQQPHIIYFAELLYRINQNKHILEKYAHVVEETAAFMADFAWHDPSRGRYILGPGVIPAQERFNPKETFNPTYELAYWRWGLETAQKWRERIGLEPNSKWEHVLKGLSPLPEKDSLYLATENAQDSYTTLHYMTDHPSVLGTYGMLPATAGMDTAIMRNTFERIWEYWQWHDTWGWDFPMTAMTATRLGDPEKAVDALLMPVQTNTYLKNGHNYQDETLRIYLPGNGGLLTALAMMAAGTEESPQQRMGFPGHWKVRSENLSRMP